MPALPYRIRQFKPEDLAELHEIDQICFPAHISFSRAELLFYINHPKSITRVIEVPGRIIGFVLSRIENARQAHFITLDVIPGFRKQKIGTRLMSEMHDELKKQGIQSAVLEVAVDNLPAQRLYERLQYRYIKTLPGYYHGCEDAYQMTRLL
jgi:[ribosomal protein S18]-alanine N-acetyltransferase